MKTNKFYTDMGQRIAELRTDNKERQADLQKALGIGSSETIYQWESGSRMIKPEYIAKLAQHYNVSADFLLLGIEHDATQDTNAASILTGLSLEAIKRLSEEKENCRIEILNKLLLTDDFWEILNIIFENKNFKAVWKDWYKKESAALTKAWIADIIENIDSNTDVSSADKERLLRLERIYEKREYEYDMSKYQCQLLFRDVIDTMLPDVGRGKHGKKSKQ